MDDLQSIPAGTALVECAALMLGEALAQRFSRRYHNDDNSKFDLLSFENVKLDEILRTIKFSWLLIKIRFQVCFLGPLRLQEDFYLVHVVCVMTDVH